MSAKKHLQSQSKEIIAKVYHRMKYEAENGVEQLTDARWRTAQAVGYSVHTITNVLNEERKAKASSTERAQNFFKSPSKRKRLCTKSTLDDFDLSVLRRTVLSFHTEFNEMPTLKKIKQVLYEEIGFDACIETLRKILRESGFEWSTTEDNRKILTEKHDIQMLRFNYLKQIKKYRDEGRYIVYTDESYAHKTHIQNKRWKSDEESLLKKLSKGPRVNIVHAGGCDGFVPNSCYIYKANSSSDYDIMNFKNYKQWVDNQLLPNIPKNSVIIVNNASYHNIMSEKIPNSLSSKNVMESWLSEKIIPFDESMKKIELYDLILKNKDRFKTYEIDDLIKSKGFEVLRIPPYHPDLNPMENIWGILNIHMAKNNVGQNLNSLINLVKEGISTIDNTIWENTCRHVIDTEKEYIRNYDDDLHFIINEDESDSHESFE